MMRPMRVAHLTTDQDAPSSTSLVPASVVSAVRATPLRPSDSLSSRDPPAAAAAAAPPKVRAIHVAAVNENAGGDRISARLSRSARVSFASTKSSSSVPVWSRSTPLSACGRRVRRWCRTRCACWFCCCARSRRVGRDSAAVEPSRFVGRDAIPTTTIEEAESDADELDDDSDEEYGYGAEDSFYSFDNDPREHGASKTHRFFRQELFGVKVRHWVYLTLFFCTGVGLGTYLWLWFSSLAQDLLTDRFGKLCNDKIILASSTLHEAAEVVDVIAEVVEHMHGATLLSSISIADCASLANHIEYEQFAIGQSALSVDFSDTASFIRGIGIAAIVSDADRDAFETIHNGTILAWDATTSQLVPAPTADLYAAIIVSYGKAASLLVDLLQVPYFAASIQSMLDTARTRFSLPYYVANYTTAVGPDADVSAGFADVVLDGSLSQTSGYRLFSVTPIFPKPFGSSLWNISSGLITVGNRTMLDITALSGLVVAMWDLTTWLHHTNLAIGTDLDAVIEVFAARVDGVRIYNECAYNSHSSSPVDYYYEDHPFDKEFLTQGDNVLYSDASSAGITVDSSVSFTSPVSPSLLYAGLPWLMRCTATRSYSDANHDWTSYVIGALVLAAVVLFSLFIFVQVRQMTAKEREVRFKNQALTELQVEREKAEQAGDAKTDFMAFLCHELRNPLWAVLSMSDSLKDTSLDADQSESVFTIHASSELMLAITNDILDLSKIEAGKIELESLPVDVAAIVQSLVRGNRGWAAEKGVTVVGDVDARLHSHQDNFVYADPTRLNQMLTNLITNAIKFTPKHGTVTVRVHAEIIEEEDAARHTTGPIVPLIAPTASISSYGDHSNALSGLVADSGDGLVAAAGTMSVSEIGANSVSARRKAPLPIAAPPPESVPELLPPSSPVAGVVHLDSFGDRDSPPPPMRADPLWASSTPASSLPARLTGRHPSGHSLQSSGGSSSNVNKPIFLHPRVPSLDARSSSPPSTPPELTPMASLERVLHNADSNASEASSSPMTSVRSVRGGGGGGDEGGGVSMPSSSMRLPSSRTIATFAAGSNSVTAATSPLLVGTSVIMQQQQQQQQQLPVPLVKSKRSISPSATPLFSATSPLAHAPASLQATLPLLLLNRHKRQESTGSPRLFGTNTNTTGAHGENAPHAPHPLSQQAHVAALAYISPPPRTRQLGRRDHSGGITGSNAIASAVGVTANSDASVPAAVASRASNSFVGSAASSAVAPMLPGQTTMTSPVQHTRSNSQKQAQRASISSHTLASSARTRASHGVAAVGLGPPGPTSTSTAVAPASSAASASVSPSMLGAAGQLTQEAEEFSRTHGQLGSVRLTFTVEDTGIGIPPEYMDALFEPYSQAKRSITRSHGGTGLGLAIVKRLGDLMAGEITVDSEVGVGTAFSFTADFLRAKMPTPAMASMIRHIQPTDREIGQVRYENYTTLRIANETDGGGGGGDVIAGRDTPVVEESCGSHSPVFTSHAPPSSPMPPAATGAPIDLKELAHMQRRTHSQATATAGPHARPHHHTHSASDSFPSATSAHAMPNRLSVAIASPTVSGVDSLASPHDASSLVLPFMPITRRFDSGGGVAGTGATPDGSACSASSTITLGGMMPPISPSSYTRDDDAEQVHDDMTTHMISIDKLTGHHARSSSMVEEDVSLSAAPVALLARSHESSSSSPPAAIAAPPPPPSVSPSKPCILVVDDAAINRKILGKMLSDEYTLDQAENGLQAVEMVDANPEKYCVVLMDLMMPVMGGTEAMQQLRSRGHTLPCIAVTANTMNEDIDKCMSLGFTSFLSKPCRKELVRSLVRQYAQQHQQQQSTRLRHGDDRDQPESESNTAVAANRSPQRRVMLSSPVLASANGQIVASMSPLPAGVRAHTMPSQMPLPGRLTDRDGHRGDRERDQPASPTANTKTTSTVREAPTHHRRPTLTVKEAMHATATSPTATPTLTRAGTVSAAAAAPTLATSPEHDSHEPRTTRLSDRR